MSHFRPPLVALVFVCLATLVLSSLALSGCNQDRNGYQLQSVQAASTSQMPLVEPCPGCVLDKEQHPREDGIAIHAILREAPDQMPLEGQRSAAITFVRGTRIVGPPPARHTVLWTGAGTFSQVKPIPWPIPDSVLFLYAAPPDEGTIPPRIATGFILRVADRVGDASLYLVTARHVVDPEWAWCGRKNPRAITVRLNRWGGGIGYESIALETHHTRQFITPSDDETDLALIPLNAQTLPNRASYKLVDTGYDQLPTEEELKGLRTEQRIVTVGVAEPRLARLIDSPISEPGVIASEIAGRPVGVRCTLTSPTREFGMWLIDTSVERGVSGAPVYAALARGPSHLVTPVLVGIQAVAWPDKGRAGITPIAALRDLVQFAGGRNQMAMNLHPQHSE